MRCTRITTRIGACKTPVRKFEHRAPEPTFETPWTRGLDNYENQSSAMQAPDGTWVGWTYWYGGGKYAEPSAIPWLDYAYALSCEEKQVTITQRTFTKIENPKTS